MKYWKIKRAFEILKNDGFSALLSSYRQYKKEQNNSKMEKIFIGVPTSHWNYIINSQKFQKKPICNKPAPGSSFTINWIIPTFGKGSGGHLNIFRYIQHLEKLGHHNRIYIFGESIFNSDDEAKRFINKEFFHLESEVYVSINDIKDSDAVFATSWQTAYIVNKIENTHKKFYFIQDYEPYFYPVGSESLFAQQTYQFDFKRITMGPWIKNLLKEKFDLNSDSIDFGHDPLIYYKKNSSNPLNNHIFFYSRPATARRCFELGVEALHELYLRGIDFKLYTVGQEILNYNLPFPIHNLGILDATELAELYSNTSLGIVFSPTNTSLLPFEMMACGCPVIELNSDSSKATFPNSDIIELADFSPLDISNSIEKLLSNPTQRQTQSQKAYEYVKPLTWESSAKNLEHIIRQTMES
jgi:O-antigen biosynthesis protein